MAVLGGGEFHIAQLAQRVSALTDALESEDPLVIGLSIQTLSVTARVAAGQFMPAHPTVMLAWSSWLTCLAFTSTAVDQFMAGDPDAVALTHDLISLSHEEYLHLVALAEDVDRGSL